MSKSKINDYDFEDEQAEFEEGKNSLMASLNDAFDQAQSCESKNDYEANLQDAYDACRDLLDFLEERCKVAGIRLEKL